MADYPFFCEICGYSIDQATGLCTNPNCPNYTVSKATTTTEG
jgi:hypothetical protein